MSLYTLTLILAITFLACATLVSGGSYAIISPKVIHPGWPLNIVVTIHMKDNSLPVTVVASLDGLNRRILEGKIDVEAGESKLLSLQLPLDLTENQYSLNVRGYGGLAFQKEATTIDVNSNHSVVLVQTDKNIYKPGQKVLFRILQLNKDLDPLDIPLTAFIVNTKGSKIERYDNITSSNGVVMREFQLSAYATLGVWSIHIQNANEKVLYIQNFEVDEYVLPKFSVEVKPDPGFLIWGIYDQPPGIIVKAMYTYGKAVQGECFLTVGQIGSTTISELSQMISETGVVEFKDIDWDGIIGTKPVDKKMLLVKVEVKDIMGRSEYEEATIDVVRGDYKVEILPQSPEIIHSGVEVEFYFKISDHFNNPATGQQIDVTLEMPNMSPVNVKLTMEEGKSYTVFRYTAINENNIKSSNNEGKIKASLASDSLISASKSVFWYYSESGESIKLHAPVDLRLRRREPYQFNVTKTAQSSFSTTGYLIVSQGIILESDIVTGDIVTVIPTYEMCPKARLIVYQFVTNDKDQEIVADLIEFSVDLCLDKEMKVMFDAKQQRTGTDADLQINVVQKDGRQLSPEVYDVFYLAVDKSIVLLQGDTVVDDNKVLKALGDTNDWSFDTRLDTAHNVFDNVKTYINTNAVVTSEVHEPEMLAGIVDDYRIMFQKSSVQRSSVKNTKADVPTPKEPVKQKVTTRKVRKDFPDTWLMGHGKTTKNGQFRTQVRLPDTITSWYVSAFGISDNGIIPSGTPFELTAFQPFFLSMTLPYSIKKGEVFYLRITVFNYRPQAVDAVIRLENSNDFITTGGKPKDNWMEHQVNILPDLASVVVFEINATVLGEITFHAEAQDFRDSAQRDEVIRKLLVKSQGEERDQVLTDVLLLVDDNSLTKTFKINWPTSAVIEGSQKVRVKVTGQVVGQSLSNLEHLVRQPTGCGEQNMIGLVPNIYGTSYIEETGQEDAKSLLPSMKMNMNFGYQRQVDKYRKKDGSYSAWATDPEGSTWLTAFVLKSFVAASKFISVDSEVLETAASFIKSKQHFDGLFTEDGRVLHKEMQSGTSEEIPLTVYCLMSILETREIMMSLGSMEEMLDKSVSKILSEISNIMLQSQDKPFLPAMTAYALSLAKVQGVGVMVDDAITNLMEFIQESNVPWLSSADIQSQSYDPSMLMTAAYTLLAHLRLDELDKGFEVMRWLQTKQNNHGGFSSTQDTVLILQALSQFGIYYKDIEATGQVEVVVPNTDFKETLDISGRRSILLQILDLPSDADAVEFTLTGNTNTVAIVKVVNTYNTPVEMSTKSATTHTSVAEGVALSTSSRYLSDVSHEVEACVSSTMKQGIGMYVTTMNLPSGEVPFDTVDGMMKQNPHVSSVESGEGVIHFYMNDIPQEGVCVKATIEKEVDFAVQHPGSAKVYSYYEPEYYKESELVLEDGCQGEPCGSAAIFSLTSFLLTTIICIMTSLLACV